MPSNLTTKLLTNVFEAEAPLPAVKRWSLADGLFLTSIPPYLLSQDDEYHVLAVEPHFSQFYRDHLHVTTLNVEYEGRIDLNYEGVRSHEADAKRKVDQYFLAGILHAPEFLLPYASFVTIPSKQKVCHSNRMRDFGSLGTLPATTFSKSDFNAIDKLYPVVSRILAGGGSGRLPTSLRYYQQAFRTDIDWSVRFLGMMMAMESLFSHGASEVSHQVSERTAFFLKDNSQEREALYEQMRDHYKLRSTIAHGGTSKKASRELTRAFEDLLLILRAALINVFSDYELTDIFQSSSSKEFNRALRHLVFHGRVQLEGGQ